MTDKLPPRAPLGAPGERTVIRPNPGGRRPVDPAGGSSPTPVDPFGSRMAPQPASAPSTPYVPPSTPGNASPDEWIVSREQAAPSTSQAAAPEISVDDLVAPNENPILRSAGPLLLLLGRLRVALARASFANLMELVADAIKFFEKDIRSAGLTDAQVNTAKYIICATADDIVQNIPTDDRHVWTQYSMLSRFFGERTGGVRFFDELNRLKQDPLLNYDVLELQHTCLALGFQGVHRTSAGGVAALQQIQRDLYETLRRIKPKAYRDLSPHWQGQNFAMRAPRAMLPWWGIAGILGLALFGLYFILLYWLSGTVDVAANDMASLLGRDKLSLERKATTAAAAVPAPVIPPAEPDKITQMRRICTALAPEVSANQIAVEQTANQIAIRIANVLLFDSGSATVVEQFKPIGARVAETLDKETGYIKIVGHTDNTPISSSNVRFPSNFQLSVERAKSVAAVLKPALANAERLQTDGKGETAPIADNKTPDGRARNRRVEVVIERTDTGPVSERTCNK